MRNGKIKEKRALKAIVSKSNEKQGKPPAFKGALYWEHFHISIKYCFNLIRNNYMKTFQHTLKLNGETIRFAHIFIPKHVH